MRKFLFFAALAIGLAVTAVNSASQAQPYYGPANPFEEAPPYDSGARAVPKPTPSPQQKLVVFTEHRDTLNYLANRVTTLLGRKEAVVMIHGGIGREECLKVQESFKHDPEVQVLLATDAAGEGRSRTSDLRFRKPFRPSIYQ
jgi:hypothetical protein